MLQKSWIVVILLVLSALLAPAVMMAQADGEIGLPIEFSGPVQSINGTTLVVNDQTIDISQVVMATQPRVGDLVGIRGQLLQDGRIIATSLVILSSSPQLTPMPTTIPVPTVQPGSQGVCPRPLAFWAAPDADWSTSTLMLGTQSYDRGELQALLNDASSGDASVRLARQLIVAKLNVAEGSATEPIGPIILQGDTLLGQMMGRLPYGILPTAPNGPAMVTTAELLDTYNRGLITPNCRPATPDTDDDDEVIPSQPIIIEGPVSSINGNIIRIYNFSVLVQPENPLLRRIAVGDIIRVDGTLETRANVIILVATSVVIVVDQDAPRGGDDGSGSRNDSDRCENGPPAHAPAHGWRHQCEDGPHPGRGNGPGRGDDGSGSRGNGPGRGDDGSGSGS